MSSRSKLTPDRLGGVALTFTGLAAAALATEYRIGTLGQMGPGFFPILLGLLLAALGLKISLAPTPTEPRLLPRPPWRAMVLIALGIGLFAATIDRLGLIIATASMVYVVSYADLRTTWRSAIMLSVTVSTAAVFIFIWLLDLPIHAVWR